MLIHVSGPESSAAGIEAAVYNNRHYSTISIRSVTIFRVFFFLFFFFCVCVCVYIVVIIHFNHYVLEQILPTQCIEFFVFVDIRHVVLT